MKLRNLLGVAAGTVGATALANRLLTARAGAYEPGLHGDQGTYRWRGFDIAYTEVGDPTDQDLVLLHGLHVAASNHEFRNVVETLGEDYHVIAPDLPGFGHSERPPLLYSASLYVTFVGDLLADLTDEPPIVVATSLTGSYAAIAARDVDLAELLLVCPTDSTERGRRLWVRSLLRAPLVGQAAFNALASKLAIRQFHTPHDYANSSTLTSDVVDYEWMSAHQPGARFAPASLVSGYLYPEDDLGDVLGDLDVPITLLWGREADRPPLSQGRVWADTANARLVVFDDAKRLPHVEHADTFVETLQRDVLVAPNAE